MPVMAKKRPHSLTPARIKAIRERLRYTQEEAARIVGVSRRQWAAWEAGENTPSGPALILIRLLDERDGKI